MADPVFPSLQPPAPATKAPADTAQQSQLAKDFEAVFLTQFVDEMMKTAGTTAFGGEKQAQMWRSFMSEAVAKSLVEQGGLGLSGNVQQMLGAYGALAAPAGAQAIEDEAG